MRDNRLDTPCLIWTGAKNSKGYATKVHDGKTAYVHRLAYEALFGPIPEGLQLDHLCRVRACYNALHLEAVTLQENVRRGLGNQNRGITHCKRGHPFDLFNTNFRPDGRRWCRECDRARKGRSVALV
jgi:hypothetical protein